MKPIIKLVIVEKKLQEIIGITEFDDSINIQWGVRVGAIFKFPQENKRHCTLCNTCA